MSSPQRAQELSYGNAETGLVRKEGNWDPELRGLKKGAYHDHYYYKNDGT